MANLMVQGYSVEYDENAKTGLGYLYGLGYEEANAFFEKAAVSGSATIDYAGSGYKLTSNGGDIYTLSKKY